jgi:NitT/TauT family transport system ATP-binding protein
MANSAVIVKDLVKCFGENRILDNVTFDVEESSLTTIVGFSGCGKSTLLNVLAGIEPITSGIAEVSASKNRSARLGYVFQSPRLLPWLTIEQNLVFVRPEEVDEATHLERVKKYLGMVGLKNVGHKFPYQLSGGMQQRAGIARALCIEPAVLLMDEPFSHLDEITAGTMREEMLRIWQETHRTILFVTHDMQEAVELGDRLIMLDYHGRIFVDVKIDLPRPRNLTDRVFIDFYSDVVRHLQKMQSIRAEELAALGIS